VTSGVAGDDDGSLAGPPVCTVSDVARYVIDARTLLRVVADDVVVDPVHQLVAPNLIRSHALDLLFADVRDGILDEQEALRRHERMTELKMRLLGDRVSRRTAWRIAMAHGWDDDPWHTITTTELVPTSGGLMSVRTGGRGLSVLLIHGIPANGELWLGVASRLVDSCRVIVPDLIGFGASVRDAGAPVDVASQAGYVVEVLAALVGDERVVVVGQDIGGAVSHVLACDHLERVAALMLMNSVAYDSWPVPVMRAAQRIMWALRRLPRRPVLASMRAALRRELRNSVDQRPLATLFIDPFASSAGYRNLLDHIAGLDPRHTIDRSARLGSLGMPFSVAWGARDRFQPIRIGDRLAADAGLDRIAVLGSARHFSPADAPMEVAAEIRRLTATVIGG
jgi:pimeloyl-ACP methyl ester carboxylesterase